MVLYSMLNKKLIWIVAGIVIVIGVAGWITLANMRSGTNDYAVVATVNGEPVVYREFMLTMNAERANVLSTAKNSSDQDTLQKQLKQATLDTVVKLKTAQLFAKDNGLIEDITYRAFQQQFLDENKRREKAAADNEPIYGPSQYAEATYFDIVNADLAAKAKKIVEDQTTFSDAELQKAYVANKERFVVQPVYTFKKITVKYTETDGESQKAARSTAQTISRRIAEGTDFAASAQGFDENVTVSDQVIDVSKKELDPNFSETLYQQAQFLHPGQVSGIFEGLGAYLIIKSVARTDQTYASLTDVKAVLEQELISHAYDNLMAQMAANAKVAVNEKVYDQIQAS